MPIEKSIIVVGPKGQVRLAKPAEVSAAAEAAPLLTPIDYDDTAKTLIQLLRIAKALVDSLEQAVSVNQQLRRLDARKRGRK